MFAESVYRVKVGAFIGLFSLAIFIGFADTKGVYHTLLHD